MSDHVLGEIRVQHARLQLDRTKFDFDCHFPAGALTAILGPSGSGKSTLLNIIAGFERPNTGNVLIDGHDVTDLSPSSRPISLVFQDNNLFSHLDLVTNIGLGIHPGLTLSRRDHQHIQDALTRVGLDGQGKRLPGSLSGGERQRAAFARALVRQRPVLLLDEPFAALDPGLRLSMVDLLAELHTETGATILLVTHDPRDVERLADYVVFLDQGKVLISSPSSDFLNHQDLPIIRQFLGKAESVTTSP